jgi:large subunit ribosomal protein L3
MIRGLWGKKIGMTQIFKNDSTVIPVTVIDTSCWVITQIKTQEHDSYNAVQVGLLRNKAQKDKFDNSWLKTTQKYFSILKEVKVENVADFTVGQTVDFYSQLQEGSLVDVLGTSKGHGFAGVVRRHGFGGGRATHGSKFHRAPGSSSFMRGKGRVIKGKRFPGHMGDAQRVVKNLEIIKVDPNAEVILVKGAVPGKSGSLVFVRKNG